MAPPSWATDEQTALLTSYVPLYETYQSTTKRYQPFWDMINAAFLEKWPILPPGVKPQDLSEVDFAQYSENLAKLYKVHQILTFIFAIDLTTQLSAYQHLVPLAMWHPSPKYKHYGQLEGDQRNIRSEWHTQSQAVRDLREAKPQPLPGPVHG